MKVFPMVLLVWMAFLLPAASAAEVNQSVDVTQAAQMMNSKPYSQPIESYRKGHVSAHKWEGKVKRTRNGFSIRLPGNYPIPTPSVYRGKLYISGGFGSKSFHCVDAVTGKSIWSISLDDDGPSSAVIEDDVVVFNTESCTIFACDANTGKMLWSWWLGDPLTSTPAIANGKVYTTYPANGQQTTSVKSMPPAGKRLHQEATHILGCFDLKTGAILWQRWIDGDAMSAPVIVDREVFITTFPGTVYRFDAERGNVLSAVQAKATSVPTVVGNDVYFSKRADKEGEVRESISHADREKIQQKKQYGSKKAEYLDGRIQSQSKIAEESKTLDAGNGFGSAPAASGYQKAYDNIGQGRVSSMQAFQGSRILHYKEKNYNSMGDELVCSDPKSGKILWKQKIEGDLKTAGGFLASPPVAVGNRIIIAALDGTVFQLDAKSGKRIKAHHLNAPIRFQPTVVNGRIYVGTQDGRVFCIDTRLPHLTGWPMWGGNAAHTGVSEF